MAQSGKPWHICDDCLDPLAKGLLSIANRFHRFFDVAEADRPGGKCRQTEPPRAFDVEALYRQYGLDLAIAWLKFNKSVEYADDFQRTLLDAKKRFSALEFKACQIINGDEGKEPTIMVRYPIQRLEDRHLEKLRKAFPDHESYPEREEMPEDLRTFEVEILDEYEAIGQQIRETGNYLRRVSALVQAKMKKADVGEAAQGDDKAEATKPTGPTSKSEQRGKWLAEAMLLVRDHPDWSDAEIARRVGKDKSTLSRSREYQTAATMARGAKDDRPRGHILVDPNSGLRDVEAYSDDPAERDLDD